MELMLASWKLDFMMDVGTVNCMETAVALSTSHVNSNHHTRRTKQGELDGRRSRAYYGITDCRRKC